MRIALIAMSGIRACDEELLRLGLTLPGVVERSRTVASLPSLGLLTLAGLTPGRHQVEYMEIAYLRELGELPAGFDLAAISSFSAQMHEAYALADRLRAAGTRVVLGGLHVTSLPDEAAGHADAIVVGEAEPVWPQLLADAEAGRLRPRYRASAPFDLADAPMPAFELLDIAKYNRLTVQTSRGCPFRCEFCASSILLTDRYRNKPVGKVLGEIDRILQLWPRPFIEFADDNSLVNRAYWRELLPELAARDLRWFTETDIRLGEEDELLAMMADAGCAQVLIGLESPTRDALDGLETRTNWKHRQWDRYVEAIRNIQSHGVTVNGCFIIGLDGHDATVFDQVFEFVRAAELYEVQVTLQTPFPGTPLYRRLKSAGRLTHDGQWNRCTLFDVNYVPAKMSVEELERGFRDLVQRLYSDEFTQWRRRRFFEHRHKRQPAVV